MIFAKHLEDYVLDVRNSVELLGRNTSHEQFASAEDSRAIAQMLGSNARALRGQRGISRKQFADCIQLDESEVAAIEAGDADFLDFDTIVRIRTCLGVDIDDLLSGIR